MRPKIIGTGNTTDHKWMGIEMKHLCQKLNYSAIFQPANPETCPGYFYPTLYFSTLSLSVVARQLLEQLISLRSIRNTCRLRLRWIVQHLPPRDETRPWNALLCEILDLRQPWIDIWSSANGEESWGNAITLCNFISNALFIIGRGRSKCVQLAKTNHNKPPVTS